MKTTGTTVPIGDTHAIIHEGPFPAIRVNLAWLEERDRLAAANLKKSRDHFGVLSTSETEAGTSESEEKWGIA